MKATELLRKQHTEVRALFKQIKAAGQPVEKRKLFEELARNLVAHDAIEREIFYPECEAVFGIDDMLGEALVEHGVVEFCLFQAEQAADGDFDHKCTVLQEMLEHHIEEEEDELFPRVEKSFTEEALATVGEQLERRFELAKRGDFRVPLYANLKQVLSGAIKTKPAKAQRPPRVGKVAKATLKATGKVGARASQRNGSPRNGRSQRNGRAQRSGRARHP